MNSQGTPLLNLLSTLVPADLPDSQKLILDMKSLVEMLGYTNSQLLSSSKTSSTLLICRLQTLNNVRCSKWHEDYVTLRLVKTYYGEGTQWCDPNDLWIRLRNYWYMTVWGEEDMTVPNHAIRTTNAGDALLMSGRYRRFHVPVLHRSPPVAVSPPIHSTHQYPVHEQEHATNICEGSSCTQHHGIAPTCIPPSGDEYKRLLFSITIK
jgi:hypothetical protein